MKHHTFKKKKKQLTTHNGLVKLQLHKSGEMNGQDRKQAVRAQ